MVLRANKSNQTGPETTAQKGFSLIEVLVATTVLIVIILGVAAIFTNQQRVAKIESARLESRQEARAVMDTLVAQTRRAGMGVISVFEEAKAGGLTTNVAANRLCAISRLNTGTYVTVSGNEIATSRISFRGELEGDGTIYQYQYDWDGDSLKLTRSTFNGASYNNVITSTLLEDGVREFALLVNVNGALLTRAGGNVYELSNGKYTVSTVSSADYTAALGSAQTFRLRVSIQRGPNAVIKRPIIQTLESNIYLRNGSTTFFALSNDLAPWASQNG